MVPLYRSGLIAFGLVAVCAVASCNEERVDGDAGASRSVAGANAPTKKFPPETAAILSISGSTALLEAGQAVNAINCAAAINVISSFLRGTGQGAEAELALRQAEAIYRKRALKDGNGRSADIAAAIDEQIARTQETPSSQSQLAVACLKQIS